jgi:putative phosphoesterase
MKLYIVVSDTHGYLSGIKKIISQYPQAHGLIHLGDYYKDALVLKNEFPHLEYASVPGNCDYVLNAPRELFLEVGGKRLLLTHGHHDNVKNGTSRLETRALNGGFDAVLFGHTHVPCYKMVSTVHVINPGSPVYPRGSSGPTYALMEIGQGDIQVRIMDL